MQLKKTAKLFLACALVAPSLVHAQASNDSVTSYSALTSFINPDKNWSVVSDAVINPARPGNFKKTAGNGVFLADVSKGETRLATQISFGDVELEFDFMLEKATTAALWLQGKYRLNLSDSWGESALSYNSIGGIAPQNGQDVSGFSGAVPLMNVAKAPGLWQHVQLRFRAPQIANGAKQTNALLEEVYINGSLVQQNLELPGASAGAASSIEERTGPIVFYSNGLFAFRNLKVRRLAPAATPRPTARRFRAVNPIVVAQEGSNYLLRSFLNFGNTKRTHVISVGSPKGVSYSYDLKQGALLQAWHGGFVDATEMWEQRGEPQLAKPLGSVTILSEKPALAVLSNESAVWPDSVRFDDFKTLGYTLDKERTPLFEYETGGYAVRDKISFSKESRGLARELTVSRAPSNLYCRIAQAASISSLGKGWYLVGDKNYYIQLDEKIKASIRNTGQGAELIVPISEGKAVAYSLIW